MKFMLLMAFVLRGMKISSMKTAFQAFSVLKVSVISIRSLLSSIDGFSEISNIVKPHNSGHVINSGQNV